MGDINYQLREAAQQYGGSPQVLQFGYGGQDPNHPGVFLDSSSQLGVNTNDPNSALAIIQRNQEAQQRAQNENSNQHNTFFSGLNLKGQQMIVDEQDRQRAQAYQDYMDAVHRLTTALEGLRGSRNESYRNANAADLTTAAALPPEAQSDDAGAAPPTAPAVPATPTTPTQAPIPQGSSHKTLYVKSKKKKARRKK
jgi:hypothetical protein